MGHDYPGRFAAALARWRAEVLAAMHVMPWCHGQLRGHLNWKRPWHRRWSRLGFWLLIRHLVARGDVVFSDHIVWGDVPVRVYLTAAERARRDATGYPH